MSTKKNKLSTQGLEKIFGKGVDNLIKEIESSNNEFKENFQTNIKIKDIIPNPYQPRKVFNKEKLNELARSITEYGVIQPILVKKTSLNNNYYLIAGERRFRASKIANKIDIPAIILDVDDQLMHEYALIENIQRVDLNPIEEALSYRELIKTCKINQEQLATKIGKSSGYISSSLRLLNLPDSIQKIILENKITMGHVKPLLAFEDKNFIENIVNKIIKEKWNVRKTENYLSSISNRNHKKTLKSSNEINEFLQNKFIEKLNTKVVISNNKISISYQNVNDLNRILEILNLLDN